MEMLPAEEYYMLLKAVESKDLTNIASTVLSINALMVAIESQASKWFKTTEVTLIAARPLHYGLH